jgi:signal transduction histidine kinase
VQSKLRHGAFDITEHVDRIMKVAASLHKDMSDFLWALDPDESTLYHTALKLKDFGDKLFDRTGIRFSLQGLAPELEEAHLPMEARQNLTCIFKEGMNNVLKHAAESCKTVTCSFARENGRYSVTLVDDGRGFDPMRCAPGKGLRNMQKRAEAIHGHLQIISRLGKGTAIRFVGEMPNEDMRNGNPDANLNYSSSSLQRLRP